MKNTLSYTHKQLYDMLHDWLDGKPVNKDDLEWAYGNLQAIEHTYQVYLQNLGLQYRLVPPILTFS